MVSFTKLLFLFLLTLSIAFVYKDSTTDPVYFIFLMACLVSIFRFLIKAGGNPSNLYIINIYNKYDLLFKCSWLVILFSWLYGVTIGLINDVPKEYIFRNFAGMAFYVLVPALLIVKPSFKEVFSFLCVGFLIQVFFAIYYTSSIIVDPASFIINAGLSEARSAYSTGFVIGYPFLGLLLAYIFLNKNLNSSNFLKKPLRSNILLYIFIFSVLYVLIIPAMSKGFILAIAVIFLVFISDLFFRIIVSFKITLKSIFFIFILIICLIFLLFLYYDIIFYSFSGREESNAIRSEQYSYIVSEFSVFGSGLGAPLASGYTRDDTGYGFELTYLSIIHKLGFVSILFFFSYILTIFYALRGIFKKIFVLESYFILGLLGFMVPGIGNPILLSPIAVLLHSISIYLCTVIIKMEKNNVQ